MELYRKYRPSNFDDIVGNEDAVKGLKKELENGSHVFLFVGPAGCGKTTLARIVAKEVGASDLCINEINSAENRGIETARDILEKMKYNPSQGDAIVWILDEMHMITNAGQNALLKALEEVPESVYFLLCTTDPQKLIKPLVSRCSIVNVSPLTDEEMKYLLKRTARAEGKKISPEVCEKIIEIAQGGSRKALKLLAKVLGLDSDEEKLSILKKETVSENEESIELCRALLKENTNFQTLARILKSIDTDDPEKIRQCVMGYMNAVLLNGNKFSPEAAAAIQAFSQADTYRNGKSALTVALLDTLELRE